PGPRDRVGVPEAITFWQSWVDRPEDHGRSPVGLLFGPSGVGKTSLIRAGLLPRLADHIRPIDVEATAEGTEARLLERLRRRCPDLPPDIGLADSLITIRKGQAAPPGRKFLIILDQFERWLHGRGPTDQKALIAALRQCDGEHAVALVVVRDDAWLGASRFLRLLGDRIVEGGGVLPIGLALLAEATKAKPWRPSALEGLIDRGDVGVALLGEAFDAETAAPDQQIHRRAARAVLRALLPEERSKSCAPVRTY